MNIVFLGTAEFACPALEALAAAREHNVAGVVTQPDRPSGRALKLKHSPVKEIALKHHFPIFQPARIREPAFVQTLGWLHPELIVVIAYGQILPPAVLELPALGCVNVHGSLLPKYRGAAPIQASLLHGDSETGVTTMFMDEGLDSGDIILQEKTAIRPADNAQTVHDRLAEAGARLLLRTLGLIAQGRAPRTPQDPAQASVCRKLTRDDGRIDWKLPAREIHNRIRAFNPWPGAFAVLSTARGGKLVKIWDAEPAAVPAHAPGTVVRLDGSGILVATGGEGLLIKQLQLEGGRRLNAHDFALGHEIPVGTVLE